MNDYTLPLMLARERIREAEAAVEENRLDMAEAAITSARQQLNEAHLALIDEQAARGQR